MLLATGDDVPFLFRVSSRLVSASNFSEKLKRMTEEESKKAFEKAVTEDQEGPWMRSKIMVVGQGRAGKTATVRSLLGKPFDPKLDSTVGASISQSNTKSGGKNWQDTKDEKIDFTTDTAARLAALKLARKRNEDANQLENFSIEDTIKYYENKQKEEEHRATVQSRDGAVFDDEEITKRFNVQLVTNKKSGLDDINFTIWDYGGQTVFYTLHHLFLTRYGIYMLAFDMREVICLGKSPEEKSVTLAQTKEYLLFWLNSVYMHATEAPLMIIGTFLDAIEDSKMLQEVDRFIKKLTVGKFDQIVQNGGLSFFPLSNRAPQKDVTALLSPFRAKVGVNIEIIRDTIEEVARKEAFVTKPLSLRWIKTLDTMLEQEESCLTLDKVREIASACHVDKPGDIDKMLAFFHELGMIVHLTSTQNLRNIVTTKPQWLVDALSKVIRDSTLHGFNMQQVETSGLLQAYNLMLKKSLVTRDWLDFLWPKDRIDFLVDLMRRTMLISDWNFGEFESEAAYLVPSLIKIIKKEDMKIAAKYLIQFEQVEQEEDEDEDEDGVNVGRVDRPGGGLKRGLNMLRAGANMKEKQEKVKVIPRAEKLGVFIGEEREVLNKKTGKTEMIKDIHNYAFRTPNKVNSVVFDFRKSFLPNGVFQRLLCLCILKCTSSQMKIAVPPKLHKNSAEINMGDGQIFRLYQFELQIMCQVVKDEVRSYRMLRSMMSKLKADVMGTGLDWDVYFEYELPQETQKQFSKKKSKEKGSLHAFMALEEAKKAKIAPWYEEGQEKKIAEEAIDVGGIELEAFLTDLDGM